MNVQELMTPAPAVCSTSDHLSRAAQIMWERDCGAVPVIDPAGQLAGIVTDRDICMATYTQGRALHEIPVDRVMSRKLFTIGPDASLQDALEALAKHAVRRLPVVDVQGRLVGMLSLADFVRYARVAPARRKLKLEDLVDALAGVSAPRTPTNVAPPPKVIVPATPRKGGRKSPARR